MERLYPSGDHASPPELTLAVATLDRPDEVAGLLASVPTEWRPKVEVVIVDQGTGRSLEPILEGQRDFASIRYERSPRRNASLARNLAARLALTPWLCFPDDDARMLPDTLPQAFRCLNNEFALVSGRIVDEQGKPHLLRWMEEDAAVTPDTIDHAFVESSFFIRREIFLSVGGFDERFGPGGDFPSAEGADLLRRLWRRYPDLPSHYTPRISIYHPAKGWDASRESCERVHRFAVGEGAFTARHLRHIRLLPLGRKLLFRAAGTVLSRDAKRQRKLAYLRGFWKGVRLYKAHANSM